MYYGPSRLLVVTLLQHLMEWLSWSVVILSTSNITLQPRHQSAQAVSEETFSHARHASNMCMCGLEQSGAFAGEAS